MRCLSRSFFHEELVMTKVFFTCRCGWHGNSLKLEESKGINDTIVKSCPNCKNWISLEGGGKFRLSENCIKASIRKSQRKKNN